MVLCQYYINNRCQFGSKCHNEHFDIKQTIKSEIEAALKGTQWPLSCFGPFKEKPCLQNFITDQSFEEVRYMCYEAKKQNTFPAYSQQFNQEVMNAKNKMNNMLSLSKEVVDAVVNLYNSNSTESTGGNNQPQKSNPFAVAGAVQSNNSNSLFGNTGAPANNPFANTGFANTAQNAGSIFGGSQQTTTATGASGGMFGQSLFGGGSSNAFGSTNNSMFGGGQSQPQQPSNVFSLPQIGGAQPTNQVGNAFGGMTAPPQTNAFGAAPNANLFATQNQPPQQGLFAQQNNQMQSAGLFGQTAQQQPFGQSAQPTNMFGQQQPAPNVFGQPNAGTPAGQGFFGNSAAALPPAANQQQAPGIFGGQNQMQQATQQQPIGFGTQPGNSVFGAPQQQQAQQIQQPSNPGAPENVFGAQTMFQQQQQPNTVQPFGGGMPNNQMVGGQITDNYIPDTAYSKIEDLTPEMLEAFKAPEFVLGKLPTVPPPRELC